MQYKGFIPKSAYYLCCMPFPYDASNKLTNIETIPKWWSQWLAVNVNVIFQILIMTKHDTNTALEATAHNTWPMAISEADTSHYMWLPL